MKKQQWNIKVKRAIMLGTMLKSIVKAGGVIKCFTTYELERMSAMELICILGPNNIEFIYNKKEN